MAWGFRKPSLKKRIAARTSTRRVVRHSLGLKAPRGMGWITNPRKAAYNRVYNRTTFGLGKGCLVMVAMALPGVLLGGCGREYGVGYPEAVRAIGELCPPARGEEDGKGRAAYSQALPAGAEVRSVEHKEVTPGQEYRIHMVWAERVGAPDYRETAVGIRKSDKGVVVTVLTGRYLWTPDLLRDLPIGFSLPWSRDMRHEEECQNAIG
ncbi:MAG: hypothetical protein NTV86_08065, partial [Planctomycetota bacterium]|nr:hypothetical protein [Planctomycetota bacterium]